MNISNFSQVTMADRRKKDSTEIVLVIPNLDLEKFYIELWNDKELLGYQDYELVGKSTEGTYRLAGLSLACSQRPYPIISLSGVLYRRLTVLSGLQQGDSSLLALYQRHGFSFLKDQEGYRYEA